MNVRVWQCKAPGGISGGDTELRSHLSMLRGWDSFHGHCSNRCCGLCLGVRSGTGLDHKTQIPGKSYVLLEARGPGPSHLMCWPKVNSWAGR